MEGLGTLPEMNHLPTIGFQWQDINLPETKSSHLKMDGWNTIVSFWGNFGLFSEAILLVSGSVVSFGKNNLSFTFSPIAPWFSEKWFNI